MIMVRSCLLFWGSIIFIGCRVPGVLAIDTLQKKTAPTTKAQAYNTRTTDGKKKQEQPKDLLNDISQKMYSTKSPTQSDLEEIDTLITKRESFIGKRPQCKREIELIRQDFEARVLIEKRKKEKKEKIESLAKKVMAGKAVMNKQRTKNPDVPFVPLEGPGMGALKDQIGQQQGQTSQQQHVAPSAPSQQEQKKQATKPERRSTSEQIGTIQKTGAPFLTEEEGAEASTGTPVIPAILETKKKSQQLETGLEPKEVKKTIADEDEREEREPVAEEQLEQESYQELPLALIEPFKNDIVQPLENAVTTIEQKVTVDAVVKQIPLTLEWYPADQQEKSIQAAATVIAQANDIGLAPTLTQTVEPIVKTLSQAIVPVKDYTQIMAKIGIRTGQKEGIKLSDLAYIMYEAGRNATLGTEAYYLFIETLKGVVTEMADRLALGSPAITASLAMASEREAGDEKIKIQKMLTDQFEYWLKSFDALLYGIDLRAYKSDGSLTKELQKLNIPFWKKTTKQVLSELVGLHALLATIGPVLVQNIRSYAQEYGPVMNQGIIEKWNQAAWEIPEYSDDNKFIVHRRRYFPILVKALKDLEDIVHKELSGITDQKEKQRLRRQLDQQKEAYNAVLEHIKNIATTSVPKEASLKKPERATGGGTFLPATLQRSGKKLAATSTPIATPAKKEGVSTPGAMVPFTSTGSEPEDESEPEMAIVPARQPTALPVINKELEEIIKLVGNLNTETDSLKRAGELNARIVQFDERERDLSQDQEKRYTKVKVDFSRKLNSIQNKQNQKDTLEAISAEFESAITNRTLINADEMGRMYTTMLTARGVLNTGEKSAYDKKIRELLTRYGQATIIEIMKENSENLLSLSVETIFQCVQTLSRIKMHLPELSVTQSVRDILVKLCTLYDHALYLVYHPTELAQLIKEASGEEASKELDEQPADEDSIPYYLEKVQGIRGLFTELDDSGEPVVFWLTQAVTELGSLLPPDEKNKIAASAWDISTIDPILLEKGKYKYGVPLNTSVTIAGKPFNTLEELTADHMKKYDEILKEWYHRISLNDTIERLQNGGIDIKTMTAEEREKIQQQLQDIKDKVPTLFEQDPALKNSFDEVNDAINAAVTGELLAIEIADILAQIEKAQNLYARNRTITKIEFESVYEQLQKAGASKSETSLLFHEDVKRLDIALSNYLTTIIRTEYEGIAGFPERGYRGSVHLKTSIDYVYQGISKDVTDMLIQLNNLGLFAMIDQEVNPFRPLYLIFLQTYGYILATFDAITAKLFDGAQNPQTWGEFLGLSSSKTQYESADLLINELLKPIAQLRSLYYEKFIEPYFQYASEVKKYVQGYLSVMDLGLKDMSISKRTYIYARSQMQLKTYGGVVLVLNPVTGDHMVFKDLSAGVIHGGDLQYRGIINNWEKIVRTELRGQYVGFMQKQVNEALDSVLNVPFGPPLPESVQMDAPTFGTLYDRYDNDLIPNPYTTFNYFLADEKAYEQLEATYYLDLFFATLVQRLDNQKLLSDLAVLEKEDALTPDIREKIKNVCAESFVLLDSVIAWAYTNIKDHFADGNRKKIVGDLLARYYPEILSIFTSLKNYVPYLNESDARKLTVSNYVRLTEPKPSVIPVRTASVSEYPFRIEQPVPTLALVPFTSTPPESKPIYLFGMSFLQTGAHSAESIEHSIKTLKLLIENLGGVQKDASLMRVVKLFDPFVELFSKKTFPSKEEIQEVMEEMRTKFGTIKSLLKTNAEGKKIINMFAQSPIIAYKRLIESAREIAEEHRQTFIELMRIFDTSFKVYFNADIAGYLNNIIAWKPLGTAIQKLLPPVGDVSMLQPKQEPTEVDKTKEQLSAIIQGDKPSTQTVPVKKPRSQSPRVIIPTSKKKTPTKTPTKTPKKAPKKTPEVELSPDVFGFEKPTL